MKDMRSDLFLSIYSLTVNVSLTRHTDDKGRLWRNVPFPMIYEMSNRVDSFCG